MCRQKEDSQQPGFGKKGPKKEQKKEGKAPLRRDLRRGLQFLGRRIVKARKKGWGHAQDART